MFIAYGHENSMENFLFTYEIPKRLRDDNFKLVFVI